MLMLPCAFWPLAEHISFGQNCCDASIGSVSVCICYSMPMDACFFNHSFPFHRIVGFYPCSGRATLIGEKAQATLRGRPRGRLGTDGSGKGCLRGRPRGRLGSGGLAPAALRGRPDLLGSTQVTGATLYSKSSRIRQM